MKKIKAKFFYDTSLAQEEHSEVQEIRRAQEIAAKFLHLKSIKA